jgi:hypothetical protein
MHFLKMRIAMENRRDQRKRTFIGAKILLNDGASVMDCLVRDLSDGGARLALDGAATVPGEFGLALSDGRSFQCTVQWRTLTGLGVRFSL